MNRILHIVLFFTTFLSFSQTKVGNIHFNDIDVFENSELMLNGAGEREKLYTIGLYLDFEVDGVEDGIMVAEKNAPMALTIKTVADISTNDLREIIRNGLERATDGNSYLLEDQIRDFIQLLPGTIHKYEIFKIVYTEDEKITLYKNKERLGAVPNSLEFKQALFKIWLGENPVDSQLKEDLLGSYDANPILGQWKTYDKKTGVAINIVQLYMIQNKVFGSIQRMLRQSERDAVCYECLGDDKNQPVEGLVILKNLTNKSGFKYVNGQFTDIKNGKISGCQIWIDEDDLNILNVKYKGGGVHQWKRVKTSRKDNREDFRTVKF
ncbi:chalcone isomerase family protein [Aquimarina sp. 2201CG14-23]|uniref:chalcone isomerase family protein n=1 Tax=Aquimarina mycalae TaxID=3040073 RepID=UPI0024780FBD|nr:chalcone isomerase family protein [Aquimarina sp. 2201CG14-23]MDH7445191.1 chalcone isomerase family protein [Aquimarina sp. 2201CG14-23]